MKKNKIVVFVLVFMLCFGFTFGAVNAITKGMVKAENIIIEIETYEDLVNFADRVNSGEDTKNFEVYLKNSIEINKGSFNIEGQYVKYDSNDTLNQMKKPIGQQYAFEGFFDGGSHTIKGLCLSMSNQYALGLFAKTNGATIQNLKIEKSLIRARNNSDTYVGAVVGEAISTTIKNIQTDDYTYVYKEYTENDQTVRLYSKCVGYMDNQDISISTIEEFRQFEEMISEDYFTENMVVTLANDIVFNPGSFLSNGTYEPEGSEELYRSYPIGYSNPFRGVFDGNNHALKGIYISNDTDYVGLFAKTINATIKNLTIEESYIRGEDYVGAVIGEANSTTILNVEVDDYTYIYFDTEKDNHGTIYGFSNSQDSEAVLENIGIEDYEDLIEVANRINSGESTKNMYITLTRNIWINNGYISQDGEYTPYHEGDELIVTSPIGKEYPFEGVFDGNGYSIRGMYIDSDEYAGLFAKTSHATIINLEISYSYIKGNNYVGAAVGYAYATIIDNVVIGDETYIVYPEGAEYAGEILGLNDNVFEIASKQDLIKFAQDVNSGMNTNKMIYVLTADITLNDVTFTKDGDYTSLETFMPIGNKNYAFNGTFDGMGHTINGLYVDETKAKANNAKSIYIALFGNVKNGNIINLNIDNAFIKGEDDIAVLCSNAKNIHIENVNITNYIVDAKYRAAGFVATIYSELTDGKVFDTGIYNSVSDGALYSSDVAGGFVANANSSFNVTRINFKNLTNNTSLHLFKLGISEYEYTQQIGGIVANATGAIFDNCVNNMSATPVTKQYLRYFGGICATANNVTITNCHNHGTVEAFSTCGGIIGSASNVTILNSTNDAVIRCDYAVGGIVGYLSGENLIKLCVNTGDIYAVSNVGGIVGESMTIYDEEVSADDTNIIRCTVECNITEDGDLEMYYPEYVGGIAGNINGKIDSSHFTGNITFTNGNVKYVGGIAGMVYDNETLISDTDEEGYIKNCYTSGNITTNGNYIGFVGSITNSKILNCYSVTDVDATYTGSDVYYGGGILGYGKNVTIDNCYILTTSTNENYGAVAGLIEGQSAVTNVYYPDTITTKIIGSEQTYQANSLSLTKFTQESDDSVVNILQSNVTLENRYDKWIYGEEYPELYKVIAHIQYDFDGGQGSAYDDNEYELADIAEIDFATIPVKDKYTFVGYILNNDESVIYTQENNTFMVTEENNVLKAIWTENHINPDDIICEDVTGPYVPGYSYTIEINGINDEDVVLFSEDGITYSEDVLSYNIPGTYRVYYKIVRNNYFDYVSYATIQIEKIELDVSNIAWQRDWYIDSLATTDIAEIEDNKFTYNSYDNNIRIIRSSLPFMVTANYFVGGESVEYLVVKNTGNYSVTATLNYDESIYYLVKKNASGESEQIANSFTFNFSIEKVRVNKPVVNGETSFVYTGGEISLDIFNSVEGDVSTYSVTNNSNVNAGTYTVTVALKDKLNFIWSDETDTDLTFTYTITKKVIAAPNPTFTTLEFDGNPHKMVFDSVSDLWTVLNNNEQSQVGKYDVTVNIADTVNYIFTDGTTNKTYSYTITKKSIAKPDIVNHNFVYDGQEKSLDIENTEYFDVLNQKATVAGTYTAIISLKDRSNTVWEDGTSDNIMVQFVIAKKVILIPVSTEVYTYNGYDQNFDIVSTKDYIVYNGVMKNAGSQTVIITLVDKANTCWSDGSSEDINMLFTISPAKIKAVQSVDIRYELVDDVLTTNISSLSEGTTITYSLSRNGTYTNELIIDRDGDYTVYYKLSRENYDDVIGSFNVKRDLDSDKPEEKGGSLWIILLITIILLAGGFVGYCYLKKILMFAPKGPQIEAVDKRLEFEKYSDSETQSKPKERKNSSNKMLEHLSGDLDKARGNQPKQYAKKEDSAGDEPEMYKEDDTNLNEDVINGEETDIVADDTQKTSDENQSAIDTEDTTSDIDAKEDNTSQDIKTEEEQNIGAEITEDTQNSEETETDENTLDENNAENKPKYYSGEEPKEKPEEKKEKFSIKKFIKDKLEKSKVDKKAEESPNIIATFGDDDEM